MNSEQHLMNIARSIRKHILHMMHVSKSSHIGSCFSIIESLVYLYFKHLRIDPLNPTEPSRDFFLLSKAHASAALYATLAERGYFDTSLLSKYYVDGGLLPGHLDKSAVPGVENSGGSLGHGLSLGSGIAYAKRLQNHDSKVYVLLGDGECNEGSVWEAAMLASHLKLSKLFAIIDYNKIQSYGQTNEIIDQSNLRERWASFGWNAVEVMDGHNFAQLESAFVQSNPTKPTAFVLHTIKGKGISFMENQLAWHYKSPSNEQLAQALAELGFKI